jgi:hypothetical protein
MIEALYQILGILMCCGVAYGTLVLMNKHAERDEELPEHCSDDAYSAQVQRDLKQAALARRGDFHA